MFVVKGRVEDFARFYVSFKQSFKQIQVHLGTDMSVLCFEEMLHRILVGIMNPHY